MSSKYAGIRWLVGQIEIAGIRRLVEHLLDKSFAQHSLAEKTEIVRIGADHPLDFTFTQKCKVITRSFSNQWFQKKTWMTCSRSKLVFSSLLFSVHAVH